MAKLNVEGSKMMENLSKELDFSYKRNGSLVVCTNENELERLEQLKERGMRNGVEGLQILDRETLKGMEPNISDEAVAALYAPTGGIVCPFGLNIALAENAAQERGRIFHGSGSKKNRTKSGRRLSDLYTGYGI